MSWQRKHSYSRLLNKVLLVGSSHPRILFIRTSYRFLTSPVFQNENPSSCPLFWIYLNFHKRACGISVWIIRIDIFLASKIEALSSGNRSDMNIPWVLLFSKKPYLFSLNLHFYSIIKNEFAFVIGNPWFSWLGLSSWLPRQDPGAICSLNIQFPRATSYLTKVCP